MITRYEFFVGLDDKKRFKNLSKNIMRRDLLKFFSECEINFSLSFIKGGYIYVDGTYILEDSVRLTCIGKYKRKKIKRFAQEIKKFYNQESVLIIKQKIKMKYKGDSNER